MGRPGVIMAAGGHGPGGSRPQGWGHHVCQELTHNARRGGWASKLTASAGGGQVQRQHLAEDGVRGVEHTVAGDHHGGDWHEQRHFDEQDSQERGGQTRDGDSPS